MTSVNIDPVKPSRESNRLIVYDYNPAPVDPRLRGKDRQVAIQKSIRFQRFGKTYILYAIVPNNRYGKDNLEEMIKNRKCNDITGRTEPPPVGLFDQPRVTIDNDHIEVQADITDAESRTKLVEEYDQAQKAFASSKKVSRPDHQQPKSKAIKGKESRSAGKKGYVRIASFKGILPSQVMKIMRRYQ